MHFSNKKQNLPILFQPFCCSKQMKILFRDPYLGIFGRIIDLEHFQNAKIVIQRCAAPMGDTRGLHFGTPEINCFVAKRVSALWFLNPRNRLKPRSNMSDHHVS